MSAAETVRSEVRRGLVVFEHLLICRDIARANAAAALAGDPDAVRVVRAAARHMYRLGLSRPHREV